MKKHDNKNKGDGGFSRQGLFGNIIHYDAKGHKIGESRPSFFGGYTDYDAKGRKIGRSEENLFSPGYTHYDVHGKKIGSSDENLFGGGYTHRDASGKATGHSGRSIFDIKPPEEMQATGSLYGKQYYHQGGDLNAPPTDHFAKKAENSGSHSFFSTDFQEPEEELIAGDFISGEDMSLLQDAGYDAFDLELMDAHERREAMEDAGVDPDIYNFFDD